MDDDIGWETPIFPEYWTPVERSEYYKLKEIIANLGWVETEVLSKRCVRLEIVSRSRMRKASKKFGWRGRNARRKGGVDK